MNTNDAQYLDNGFIPVRITNRADTTCCKHGSYVVSRPFDSHIVISTYFAICCDVHSNSGPENTSPDRRLVHDSREQLLSLRTSNHNNGSSNINDITIQYNTIQYNTYLMTIGNVGH